MSSNATHLWQLRLEWPSSVALFVKLYSWSSSSQQVKNHVLHKNLLSSLISVHDLECLASIFWDQHQKLKCIGLPLSRHGWNSLQTAPLSSSCQGICHHCYNNLLCHWIHQLDTSEPGRCCSMCQKREVQASGLIFSLVVWQSRSQLLLWVRKRCQTCSMSTGRESRTYCKKIPTKHFNYFVRSAPVVI